MLGECRGLGLERGSDGTGGIKTFANADPTGGCDAGEGCKDASVFY